MTAPLALADQRVQWRTWANLITLIRTVVAIVLGAIAIVQGSVLMLAIAYAVYWIGDSADGNVARMLKQETRFGAVFDILCDRANSSLLLVGLLAMHHEFAWPLAIYFVQFMVVDLILTLSFLLWPLVSPTRKRVSGSTSLTTPTISIISSLAKCGPPHRVGTPEPGRRRSP